MEEKSLRVVKRHFGLTTIQWILVLALAAAIVLTTFVCYQPRMLEPSEEPPIVVKNGSLDSVLQPNPPQPPAIWVPDDASNQTAWIPSQGKSKGKHDIKVADPTNTANCNGWNGASEDVTKVVIVYSDGFELTIKPGNSPGKSNSQATPVPSQTPFPANPAILRHPDSGTLDEYIKSVTVSGGGQPRSCTFTSISKPEITITPSKK